jgi:predicted aminopeptidase
VRGAVALALGGLLVASLSGCFESRYLADQGVGQWRLFRARRRVSEVLGDPVVDERIKARLRLAMEARKFGVEVLGLRGGDNYTRFLPTGGKAVAWNLTAAPKDALRPKVWRFPIVGTVPYLGFFDEKKARKMQAALKAQDYDTYVRPVAGYSTIGLTSDPIYESMLDEGDARLVEVVLHEMLHGTMYLSGKSAWNESLASFVGVHGAAMFFAQRGGDEAAQAVYAEAEQRKLDEKKFSTFLAPIRDALEALYRQPISRAEKIEKRKDVFAMAKSRFLEMYPGRRSIFTDDRLNNAVMASYGVYHDKADEHEHLYRRVRGDLREFLRLYKYAIDNTSDPIEWLAQF